MAAINKYIEKIARLPLLQRSILATLLLAGVIVGFYQLIYKDLSLERNELAQKIQETEDKIAVAKKLIRDLPKFEAETRELDQKLAVVLRELPDAKEIERFLRSISALAVDTGLEVVQFVPGREVRENFVARIPVELQLEGTFHQLATFLDEVGHLPRIVNMRDLAITIIQETPNEVSIRVSCTAVTYRYLEPREVQAVQDGKTADDKIRQRS